MRRKKFDQIINYYIKNDVLTHASLEELAKNNIKAFVNDVSFDILLRDNVEKLIFNCVTGYKYLMINYLCCYKNVRDEIKNKFVKIFKSFDKYELCELLNRTSYTDYFCNLINDNFDELLKEVKPEIIIEVFVFDKNKSIINQDNVKKLNTFVENNKLSFSKVLYNKSKFDKDNVNLNSLYELTFKLVKELLGNNNFTDIKIIGVGSYSKVFLINDKVLKIGLKRKTYKIPNDKRILKPLIRVNINDYCDLEGTIEICNKVDTNVNLSIDELYELYKELRERHIIYTDLRNVNLGYLLQDNNTNYNGLDESINGKGFYNENSEVLKKGDLVIIDTDFLYYENDPNLEYGCSFCEDFEKRYQKELNSSNDNIYFENEIINSKTK